jgi:hypothetical protein
LLSISKDKITSYDVQNSTTSDFVLGKNPIAGKPVSALYTYKWGGLDTAGNPQGYINGKKSIDYDVLENSSDSGNIVYSGPQTPTLFGGLTNTFSYKHISLYFNIIYRMGYYFIKPSVNYYNIFYTSTAGSKDFEKRWQKPGDENTTTVPSMTFPANQQRDQFYQYSSIQADKGDFIRLQDIQLSYDLNRAAIDNLPFENVRLYVYASNIGNLWKANKDGIDPYNAASGTIGIPLSRTYSVGMKIDFK